MTTQIKLEKALEDVELKLKNLAWQERKATHPDVSYGGSGANIRLHQFTTIDRNKQIFIYKTTVQFPETTEDPGLGYFGRGEEYTVPASTETSYGLAIFRARKTMADFFQPRGIIIWKGTYARPTKSEGLIVHCEEYDPPERTRIKTLYNRLRSHKKSGKTKIRARVK